MKKSDIQNIIREEFQNHLIEESVVNWMLDKVEDFVKSGIKSKTEYTLARIYKDPKFRNLSKKFNMSEKDFMAKATSLIKSDPKKFEDLLVYDVRKGNFSKYFK